jgi:hypothetical protein
MNKQIISDAESNNKKVAHKKLICSNCDKMTDKRMAKYWMYFSFRHLDPTDLCPDCCILLAPEIQVQQMAGL